MMKKSSSQKHLVGFDGTYDYEYYLLKKYGTKHVHGLRPDIVKVIEIEEKKQNKSWHEMNSYHHIKILTRDYKNNPRYAFYYHVQFFNLYDIQYIKYIKEMQGIEFEQDQVWDFVQEWESDINDGPHNAFTLKEVFNMGKEYIQQHHNNNNHHLFIQKQNNYKNIGT